MMNALLYILLGIGIIAAVNAIYYTFQINEIVRASKYSRLDEYIKAGNIAIGVEIIKQLDKAGVFDLHSKNISQMKNNSDYYSPEDRKKYNELYYQNNKKTLDAKNRARLKNFMRRRRTLKKVLAQVESSLKKTPMKCDEIQP